MYRFLTGIPMKLWSNKRFESKWESCSTVELGAEFLMRSECTGTTFLGQQRYTNTAKKIANPTIPSLSHNRGIKDKKNRETRRHTQTRSHRAVTAPPLGRGIRHDRGKLDGVRPVRWSA